jgi:hypothetical protein
MATYKKFLIRQQTYNGTTYTNIGTVVDTQESFSVVCQECPFKKLPKSKELATRNWHDENGDDVYFPTDGLKFEAYDMDVTFLYVGTESSMSSNLCGFIDFLYGRNNGGSPCLAIYDEYTKTGRQGVYVKEVDNTMLYYNDISAGVIAAFKVKFSVSDPVTDITLSSSSD